MLVSMSSAGHELRSRWSRELVACVALAGFARAVRFLMLEVESLE